MKLLLLMIAVFCAGGYFILRFTPVGPALTKASPQIAVAVGLPPDKLGWMDDADFTSSDRERVALITGHAMPSDLSVIRSIQGGARGNITRRDFELLRQDRRRARAAYPDVKPDDLIQGGWLNVDMSARIPSTWCTSGNSNGTQGSDGEWYLDGGCYVSIVRAQYTERADAATTKRVLAELEDAKVQKRLAHLKRWGTSGASSGTGGSYSFDCNPDPLASNNEENDRNIPGQCVVIIDQKTKYIFPFVARDWAKYLGATELITLAESHGAQATEYVAPPPRPWVARDGALARGQTGKPGRLYWSQWNADKDDYDNEDIGPDTPESWIIGTWGLSYLPAPDNGERLSVPGKPWFIVATYYGYAPQISGGWTEKEAKETLPKLRTAMVYGMQGQDPETLNRGNLKEARATQVPPNQGVITLADRALPVQPFKQPQPSYCQQGGTIMPGQTCVIGIGQ
jgi:hypothetical protein